MVTDELFQKSDASDTEGLRIHRTQEHENGGGQGGERGRCDADDFGEIQRGGDATDTGNQGLQRSQNNGDIGKVRENGNKQFAGFLQPTFAEFPTQPPVRSRNDGVSTGLVGITVSKHRNESIKAYGNAVVPQVVYQIFKAINEYEKQYLH